MIRVITYNHSSVMNIMSGLSEYTADRFSRRSVAAAAELSTTVVFPITVNEMISPIVLQVNQVAINRVQFTHCSDLVPVLRNTYDHYPEAWISNGQ